ncbi:MAG: guanylate kinase [candidate division WOR-3 bacterium]|nr:guanylate kinase [candidate division WOR-3 bacterium]
MNKKAKLIVISGPSGVGKTTICNEIISRRKDIVYSISATSRPKRKGEVNGREYFFLTEEEFKRWIEEDRFVEYAVVHGNYYGTPRAFLEENLKKGFHVLMDIDVQGARKLMPVYPDGIYIFILPPDFDELKKRLFKRNTDDECVIEERLKNASEELKYLKDYKYVIKNIDLDKTVDEILEIIDKETGQACAKKGDVLKCPEKSRNNK